jgi:RNA polymerase subunit RPABC4/transcription elongation factor Spt4
MTPNPYPTTGGYWSDRRRLRQFRRRHERLRFTEEIKLVPTALYGVLFALLALAEFVALGMCRNDFPQPWPVVVEYGPKTGMLLTGLIVLAAWTVFAIVVCFLGYVFVDSRRRGMNTAKWMFICIGLLPAYLAMGFILYFSARDPLPYHCPRCGSMVNARYNFCPSCKTSLHPTCTHCQREVGDMDKFCPYCGTDVVIQVCS